MAGLFMLSEKFQLFRRLMSDTLVVVFEVFFDDFFAHLVSHTSNRIAVFPGLSTPEVLLLRRKRPKYFPRCYPFDEIGDLRRGISRWRLQEYMHMIVIHSNSCYLKLVSLCYLTDNPIQKTLNRFLAQKSFAVFRTPNEMIP